MKFNSCNNLVNKKSTIENLLNRKINYNNTQSTDLTTQAYYNSHKNIKLIDKLETNNIKTRPNTCNAREIKYKYNKMFAEQDEVKKKLKGRLINLINKHNLISVKDLNSEVFNFFNF